MLSRLCREGKIYILRRSVERLVKSPLGKIYTDENIGELKAIIREVWARGYYVSSVGDRVTYTLVRHGVVPDLAVIDEVEKRGEAPKIDYRLFNRVYRGVNEKGTINMGLCSLFVEALKYRPSIVVIDGEEDLTGFPVVLALPVGSIFLYGQPGVGMVLVRVDESVKRAAEDMLSRLDVLG
jgi:hypothetical protein